MVLNNDVLYKYFANHIERIVRRLQNVNSSQNLLLVQYTIFYNKIIVFCKLKHGIKF